MKYLMQFMIMEHLSRSKEVMSALKTVDLQDSPPHPTPPQPPIQPPMSGIEWCM